MFNTYEYFFILDEYIIYYKSFILEPLIKDMNKNKIKYDDYYNSSERSFYFNLIKTFNNINKKLMNQ
jgi:hypothetical protein